MNDNGDDKKLNWMYKGPNSMVNRDEYLLGRSVDKTLEQIDAEEKSKTQTLPVPKNHVEHECIPPSIRDFNKIVQAEQVDLSAKLQEDPLVAIKKREEEARRQFLQNPVQLKKLQKALEIQASKKIKKKKKHKDYDDSASDIDDKISEKLALLKNSSVTLGSLPKKSKESSLDTILMHKFNQFKDKLTEEDLKDILAGKDSDDEKTKKKKKKRKKKKEKKKSKASSSNSSSDDSEDEERSVKKSKNRENKKILRKDTDKYQDERRSNRNSKEKRRDRSRSETSDHNEYKSIDRNKNKSSKSKYDNRKVTTSKSNKLANNSDKKKKHNNRKHSSSEKTSSNNDSDTEDRTSKIYMKPQYDSDGNEIPFKPQAWGLVKSDGTKIELKPKPKDSYKQKDTKKSVEEASLKKVEKRRQTDKLTEEEKDKLRREMMQNAQWRDKERSENIRIHREKEKREEEKNKADYNEDFVHKELIKSANTSSVEGRIKSNLNNIQRSSTHMDSHFSRR